MQTEEKEKPMTSDFSFEDSPLEYCNHIVKQGLERIDTLRAINDENLEFYMGIDVRLEERRNNPKVKRSSVFVHALTPGIESIVGDAIASLEQLENPVRLRCAYKNPTPEQKARVVDEEQRLNDQLRNAGYFDEALEDQIRASHITRSPSVVKFYWNEEKIPYPSLEQDQISGESKVRWKSQVVGAPQAMWIPYDEFLYPANVSSLRQAQWSGHQMKKNEDEVEAYLQQQDKINWKEVKKWRKAHQEAQDAKRDEKTQQSAAQQALGTPLEDCMDGDLYILNELYVITYDKKGYEITNQVIMLGGKYLFRNARWSVKGPRFPFDVMIGNRLPGQIEGLSSVDRGKPIQQFHSEAFNAWSDATSYRIGGPMKKSIGNDFGGEPKWEPGAIWELSDPKDLEPVMPPLSDMTQLPALVEATGANIRNVLGSSDLEQGFQASEYEKAAGIKARMLGSAKRSFPNKKKTGLSVVHAAQMFLALNQNYSETPELWVEAVIVDCPSLTGATDPEQEKQDDLLLLQTMAASPIYATPNGQRKIRNMMEDMVRKFKRTQVDLYVPTEREFEEDLQIQTQMQQVQADMALQQNMMSPDQMPMQQARAGVSK